VKRRYALVGVVGTGFVAYFQTVLAITSQEYRTHLFLPLDPSIYGVIHALYAVILALSLVMIWWCVQKIWLRNS
jgi:hypothetical protein